jgi:enediyne biosynthesis protein E5
MRGYLGAGGDRRLAALRRFAFSISVFTLAGHTVLGFEQAWAQPLVTLAWIYALELTLESVDAWGNRRPARFRGGASAVVDFLLPAHIAGLAISMLLYPNARFSPLLFAATVCVASKHLVRAPIEGRRRHVLNPSNVGISATLLLFPAVGISPPYQYTENLSGVWDWVIPLVVFGSGLLLNHQLTGKTPLILAWTAGFAVQALIRSAIFDMPVIAGLLPLTGMTFMLFTTYMITDPGSSPRTARGQIAFGLTVAAVYGVLMASHIVFGLFFALSIVGTGRLALLWVRTWVEAAQHARVSADDAVPAGV